MVNYQKSKIYKIISPHTEKCYVGSTTKDRLSNRLAGHRVDLKNGKNIYICSVEIERIGGVGRSECTKP